MKVYYLKPIAPFHLQTGSLDHESVETFPKADTFSAALTYLWFRQYGSVPGFPDEIPFRVSSLMPAIVKDNVYIRCYPKPVGLRANQQAIDHKTFKKIGFMAEPVFEKWRKGALSSSDFPADVNDVRLWAGGKIWADEAWNGKDVTLYRQQTRTRVISDRITNQTTPFHFASTMFGPEVHLFFLAEVNPEHEVLFQAMLRLLGDEGLGADRTVGMGLFNVEEQTDEISFEPSNPSGWINLGIFNPSDEDVNTISWDRSRYGLFNRYGWTSGRALRRRTVAVLGEGSFISASDRPSGTIRNVLDPNDVKLLESDIQLDHAVYRDCRGFFVPVQI